MRRFVGFGLSVVLGVGAAQAVRLSTQEHHRSEGLGASLRDLRTLASKVVIVPPAYGTSAVVDRLVLIKYLYFLVNGGANGTWPDGASSAMTGADAPSDRLVGGFLGLVNDIVGPAGAVSTFLEAQGFEKCADLPDTATNYDLEDAVEGDLTITISDSERTIPSGLTNSGSFEKRILIQRAADDSRLAVLHLHCSQDVMTMLVRITTDLETEGEEEEVEILVEGSVEGPDIMLEFVTQKTAAGGRDLVLKFETDDGDSYQLTTLFTSSLVDASGNGPAHLAVGIAGVASTGKAKVHVMGANEDLSAASASLDVAGLPLDVTLTPDAMAEGNQSCLSMSDVSETTGCPTVADPGSPRISGLESWTLEGIYALRQGETNVDGISEY